MRRLATRLARRADPRLKAAYLDLLHRWRWRRYAVRRVTLAFVRHHGLAVLEGPFAGLRFPEFAVGRGEMIVPQLLGAYEQELHPAFERVIAERPELIVDVGASDGYYAVGLALRCPDARVIAYEMNPFPARVCRALIAANGVGDRVDLRGECRTEELRGLPSDPRTFVLCDAEGAEQRLMDPAAVPQLARAGLVVELHDFAAPGIEATITERFEPTHEIEIIRSARRYTADYPKLSEVPGIDYMDRELGVSEFRPVPISWAVLTPRT